MVLQWYQHRQEMEKGNLNEWETGMELKEKKRIKISVRNLVEFVMKSGDIDNRRTAGADREAKPDSSENPEADGLRLPGRGAA